MNLLKKNNIFPFLKNINNRRVLHYTLLSSVVLLLFLLLLLLYNEIVNEKKLNILYDKLFEYDNVLTDIKSSENDLIQSQQSLVNFIVSNSKSDLDKYYNSVKSIQNNLQKINIDLESNDSILFKTDQNPIEKLNNFIQNINQTKPIQHQELPENVKDQILNTVLLSTTVETNKSVDSVQKKGFFGRIGDAVKGKNDVQVEKTEMTITYKYGNEVKTGTLNQYVAHTTLAALNEYEKRINTLKNKNEKLSVENRKHLQNNDSIMRYSNFIFQQYQQSISKAKQYLKIDYDKQYVKNRYIRLYSIFGITFLILLIVGASSHLTTITYHFEEEITKAKELINQNLQFKNRIVSMLSHEVRSPLQMISILSNRIEKNTTEEKQKKAAQSIGFTSNSIMLLTNQILAYSKYEQKTDELNLTPVDLNNELHQLLKSFKPLIESKNNTLTIHNEITHGTNILIDVPKLHQLYYNILGNAVKFTENGQIIVFQKLMHTDSDNFIFDVQIQDTGSGIEKEDLKEVMGAYKQGKNVLQQHKNLGVGLGLYLCKEIVDLYKGKIDIQSEVNQGTLVSFQITLKKI